MTLADPRDPQEPIALTQSALAARLTVSDRTIRRWEREGLLRGRRVGGVKLYPIEQVKKLLAA